MSSRRQNQQATRRSCGLDASGQNQVEGSEGPIPEVTSTINEMVDCVSTRRNVAESDCRLTTGVSQSEHGSGARRDSTSAPEKTDGVVHLAQKRPRPSDASPQTTGKAPRKKFNVAQAYAKLEQAIKIPLQQDVSLVTLNIGGLRSPYRVESLKEMIHQLKVGIAVITETHMLDDEMDALQIPGYELVHKYGVSKFMGGVMILAGPQVNCRKLTSPPLLPAPIDSCSCIVYPKRCEEQQMRLTGIYLPPSAEAIPSMLRTLTKSLDLSSEGGLRDLTHLIVGDLNPNTWKHRDKDLYHEWISEEGLWELSHPELPTYKTGAVLDKFLLQPGNYIPGEWLSAATPTQDIGGPRIIDLDLEYYPAHTFPEPWIGDHHPVMLSLSTADNQQPEDGKHTAQIKVKDFTPDEWTQRNEEMQQFLLHQASKLRRCEETSNTVRLVDILLEGLRHVF